ncbi:acetyl-CoA acetyltransferase [Desulfurococcaceae archaeon AG1]|jgi:acetyl-CoA C-acetyltransferase|nr:MAG: acetyl-CoA C-acyltransferase [Desulfurococcaceae archaeon]GAY25528.1 acetyl-CoA acetyltransferase [Desulfurococcaceae archaeon AG1]
MFIKFDGIVILSAVRTPIGKFGRTLRDLKASELGSIAIREAISRADIDPEDIGLIAMGNVIRAGGGMLTSKQAAILAGLPPTIDCMNIDMVCSSGMASIATAALYLDKGAAKIAIAGGMESMSSSPYLIPSQTRWGVPHLTNRSLSIADAMLVDGLIDPFTGYHMGKIADLYARRVGASREDLDLIALESHMRAAKARDAGIFSKEIVPVRVSRNGTEVYLDRDEGIRDDVSLDKLRSLNPVFTPEGPHTAGSSSQLSDGAAALVLAREDYARERGYKPLARLIAYSSVDTRSEDFPWAPVPAVKELVKGLGIELSSVDLYENNEAFAVSTYIFVKELGISMSRLNVHGGAIALGHPLGATGARLTTTLINALKIRGGRRGIASMCHGLGGGTALMIEIL